MSLNYKKVLNDISKRSDFRPINEMEKESLKKCLYEMACDLDERCRKNGLKMFLVGGTLLGAVRHGGFIPWDDDMDLAMSRDDYKRLIEIFDEEFFDKYEIRCPNTKYPNGNRFMQIFKKGTILRTLGDSNPLQPKSVYIDIFPYDYVPESYLLRKLKGYKSNFLMVIASCVMDYVYPDEILLSYIKKTREGQIINFVRKTIGKIFSFRTPEKWFNRVDNSIIYKNETNYVTSATGRRHYFGEIYNKNVFFPLIEMKFKEHVFYAPAKKDIYLKGLYGEDYLIPPCENLRESHFISELKV